MPSSRDVVAPHQQGRSGWRMVAFYQKYKIEFHISGMVFCLIGGKVRRDLFFVVVAAGVLTFRLSRFVLFGRCGGCFAVSSLVSFLRPFRFL